jgi:hypothetical protein
MDKRNHLWQVDDSTLPVSDASRDTLRFIVPPIAGSDQNIAQKRGRYVLHLLPDFHCFLALTGAHIVRPNWTGILETLFKRER